MYSLSCGGHQSEMPRMRLKSGVSVVMLPARALGRIHPVPLPAVVAARAPWLHHSRQSLWSRCRLFSSGVTFPSPLSHKDACGCISGPPWMVQENFPYVKIFNLITSAEIPLTPPLFFLLFDHIR